MKKTRIITLVTLTGLMICGCINQNSKPQINNLVKEQEDKQTALHDFEIAKKLINKSYYYSAKKIIGDINYSGALSNELDSIKTLLDTELGTNPQEYQRKRSKKWEELTTRNQDDTQIWFEQKRFTHYTNTNLMSIYYGIDRQPSSSMLNSPIMKITYFGKDWIYFLRLI